MAADDLPPDMVNVTGSSLDAIIQRVVGISGSIGEVARSSSEQSVRISQVNRSIREMGQMTQQNAAMVEESTAAAATLAREAEQLAAAFAIFTIDASPTTAFVSNGRRPLANVA